MQVIDERKHGLAEQKQFALPIVGMLDKAPFITHMNTKFTFCQSIDLSFVVDGVEFIPDGVEPDHVLLIVVI